MESAEMAAELAREEQNRRTAPHHGVDEEAADAAEGGMLETAGVSVQRVALGRGPVFENVEREGHRRQRWLSPADRLPVSSVPAAWRAARGWLLVPVAGEVGNEWAAAPSGCGG